MEAMGNDVCRSCGACCASLRVGFPDTETTRKGGTVPLILTEPWIPHHVRMRGTAETPPRCAALEGEIGKATSCSIYGNHPSPCKALVPSTPDAPNPWCDQSRVAHGLTPLSQGAAAPSTGERKRRTAEKAEKAPEKAMESKPPESKPAEAKAPESKPPEPAPAPAPTPPAPEPPKAPAGEG
jgi:Fe-S-cluster containining protein